MVGTDSDELEHSINAVYGSKFNSAAYLHRFFSYTYNLSTPNTDQWIEYLLSRFHIDLKRFVTPQDLEHRHIIRIVCDAADIKTRDYIHLFFLLQTLQETTSQNEKIDLIFSLVAAICIHTKSEDYIEQLGQPGEAQRSPLYSAFSRVNLNLRLHGEAKPIKLHVYMVRMHSDGKMLAIKVLNKEFNRDDVLQYHIKQLINHSQSDSSINKHRPRWTTYVDALRTASKFELEGEL